MDEPLLFCKVSPGEKKSPVYTSDLSSAYFFFFANLKKCLKYENQIPKLWPWFADHFSFSL